MSSAVTYWHIAHPTYVAGSDLLCRDRLDREGRAPEWAWGEAPEGFDGNVVCLFADTVDGREQADWLWYERPDHVLLKVEIPAGTHDAVVTEVEEGFPAVDHQIPAAWITKIRRGYAESAIA